MVENEYTNDVLAQLSEQAEVIADLLEEIRDELQWGVRNDRIRIVSMAADPCADDMRLNEATGATMCIRCDVEVDSLAEAMRQGWTQFQRNEPPTFLGVCPGCAEKPTNLEPVDEAETISELTKCESCEAEAPSPQEALKAGWDSFRKGEECHFGRCPECASKADDATEPGRLF